MSQINLRISSGCNAVHTSSGIPGKRLCNNRNWTSHKSHWKQTLFRHRSSPLSSASCTRYATLGPPTTSCGCISCTLLSPESSQYCQVNNSNEEKKSKFSWVVLLQSILFLLLAKCTEVFGEKNSTVILASIYIMDIPLNVIVGAVSEEILGGDPQVTFKLIPNSYENRHFS